MRCIAKGRITKLKEKVTLMTDPGFSLIKNLIELNVPNLTV